MLPVAVKSDNSVWFTDPPFGILGNYEGHVATPELPTNVYRIDAGTGQLSVITGEVNRPNGLCFSPYEAKLYIIEAGVTPRVIRRDIYSRDAKPIGRIVLPERCANVCFGGLRRNRLFTQKSDALKSLHGDNDESLCNCSRDRQRRIHVRRISKSSASHYRSLWWKVHRTRRRSDIVGRRVETPACCDN